MNYKVSLRHYPISAGAPNYEAQSWEMTITDDTGTGCPTVNDVIQYFTITYPTQSVVDGSVSIEPCQIDSRPRGEIKFIEAECVVTFMYRRVINGYDVWTDGIMAINTNPFDQIKLSEAFQAQFPGLDIKDISLFFGTTREYLAFIGVDENGNDQEEDIAKSFKRRSRRFAQITIEKGDISVPRYINGIPEAKVQEEKKVPREIVSCYQCRFFEPKVDYEPKVVNYMVGYCRVPLPPMGGLGPMRLYDGTAKHGCVLGERENK